MPVAIKIKRFETVGDVPNTSELVDGEIAVNVADKKIYVRDGSSIVTISGADFSAVGEDIIPDEKMYTFFYMAYFTGFFFAFLLLDFLFSKP